MNHNNYIDMEGFVNCNLSVLNHFLYSGIEVPPFVLVILVTEISKLGM